MTDTTHAKRLVAASLLGALLLLLSACSKVTQENYDKLTMGMKYSEVVELLGEPNNCKELMQIKQCVWGNASKEDELSISINFIGNNVVLFSSTGLQ
jgi:Domain of Unknown Function with PDB structure (DUF3862)